jgi:hypothetical protein
MHRIAVAGEAEKLTLDEYKAKRLLECFGIPVSRVDP